MTEETPASLLKALSSKINSPPGDTYRMKTEIQSQIQAISSKHEIQHRQIESQLTLFTQTLHPTLQSLDRQTSFSQSQIDDLRQSLTNLSTSPLMHQTAQLSQKLDRFTKLDLDNKLKPLNETLKQSKSKHDSILSTFNSIFKRASESLGTLIQKVDQSIIPSQSLSNDFSQKLDALISLPLPNPVPTSSPQQTDLPVLTQSLAILRNDFSMLMSESADTISMNTDRLHSQTQSSKFEILSQLDRIESRLKVAQNEGQVDQLLRTSFEFNTIIQKLLSESRTTIQTIESKLSLSQFSQIDNTLIQLSEIEGKTIREQAEEEITKLRTEIETKLKTLQQKIRTLTSSLTLQAKLDDRKRLNLETLENQIEWCISFIQKVDDERIESQFTPLSVNSRLTNVETRLNGIEARIGKISGKRALTLSNRLSEGAKGISNMAADLVADDVTENEVLDVAKGTEALFEDEEEKTVDDDKPEEKATVPAEEKVTDHAENDKPEEKVTTPPKPAEESQAEPIAEKPKRSRKKKTTEDGEVTHKKKTEPVE